MYQAVNISGDIWAVTETDVDGNVVGQHRVAIAPGGLASDAIAAITEARSPMTSGEVAAESQAARTAAIKLATRRRIYEIANRDAQINLATVNGLGLLTSAELSTYTAGQVWVTAMRAKCIEMIADPAIDYTNDALWPPVPAGVATLAAQY